jgi:hypothetical protein
MAEATNIDLRHQFLERDVFSYTELDSRRVEFPSMNRVDAP